MQSVHIWYIHLYEQCYNINPTKRAARPASLGSAHVIRTPCFIDGVEYVRSRDAARLVNCSSLLRFAPRT